MLRKSIIACTLLNLLVANCCFAHQYDKYLIADSKPGVFTDMSINKLLVNDVKQATEYASKVYENEDIKLSVEIVYELNNLFNVVSTSYSSEKDLDFLNVLEGNQIFYVDENGKKINILKPAFVLMEIKNKTTKTMTIDLQKSIFSLCYEEKKYPNTVIRSGHRDAPAWIGSFTVAPQTVSSVKLYPYLPSEKNLKLETDKELLGSFYIKINGVYVHCNFSGKINAAKLHWKADPELERNKIIPQQNEVIETKEEKISAWAL